MRKGFDEFMKNPYYREQYENAPTERLKRSMKLNWDMNPFVMGANYKATKEQIEEKKKLKEMGPNTREEVEYLAKYAVGGAQKAFFKKWLAKFDEEGK